MPNPKRPHLQEFFVYELEARGIPFYIGIGRSKRADYRLSFVRRQVKRQRLGMTSKWVLHTRVIAALFRRGVDVRVRYTRKRLRRDEALAREKKRILRLASCGHVLANCRYNPFPPSSAKEVIRFVMKRLPEEV